MLSGDDLFVCLVAGFALPLALLDLARAILEDRLPVQTAGFQLEMRLLPWLLAILTGPALLFERVVEGCRTRSMRASDVVSGAVIVAGWSFIYGYVFVTLSIFVTA
jgi:hypothetical protein